MSEAGEQESLEQLEACVEAARAAFDEVVFSWLNTGPGHLEHVLEKEYIWHLDGYKVVVEANMATEDDEAEANPLTEENCFVFSINFDPGNGEDDEDDDDEDDIFAEDPQDSLIFQLLINFNDPEKHTVEIYDSEAMHAAIRQLDTAVFNNTSAVAITAKLQELIAFRGLYGADSKEVQSVSRSMYECLAGAILDDDTKTDECVRRLYNASKFRRVLNISSGKITKNGNIPEAYCEFATNDEVTGEGLAISLYDDGGGIISGQIDGRQIKLDLDPEEPRSAQGCHDEIFAYRKAIAIISSFCEYHRKYGAFIN